MIQTIVKTLKKIEMKQIYMQIEWIYLNLLMYNNIIAMFISC